MVKGRRGDPGSIGDAWYKRRSGVLEMCIRMDRKREGKQGSMEGGYEVEFR